MSIPGILTGEYFINGDEACAEGAIAAGCRFFAGYPITPATEIAERLAKRLPQVQGMCIQMEDEIASMAAILGASWGGVKAMTATSGPGFSLMMENIGLGMMTETPCVVVDIMRAGPSTGLPTLVGQADVMQARWGSHGDYGVIALAPSSPQEMFDLTITAFNLSETFRLPVFVLGDEMVGHMSEKVVIPPPEQIQLVARQRPDQTREGYLPFLAGENLVPSMACAGDGYHVHVTGLTHDEQGYPVITAATHERLVRRLVDHPNRSPRPGAGRGGGRGLWLYRPGRPGSGHRSQTGRRKSRPAASHHPLALSGRTNQENFHAGQSLYRPGNQLRPNGL
jgi:2-oxoglutarate ferredoxin oxidoreductase subunit alpha